MGKIFMNWSSGKDSSMALNRLIIAGDKPELLFTIINKETQRIGMHGLSRELLERQAAQIGIPLRIVELSDSIDHNAYNELMTNCCTELKEEGFDRAAFGDIFLEDLRKHREDQLRSVGIEAVFPLWKVDTVALLHEFIDLGFQSTVVAANKKYFDTDFVGSLVNHEFIQNLPAEVDPCGENGEFHTFCFDGPIFKEKVPYQEGERIIKTYPQPNRKKSDEEIAFHFLNLI